MMRRREEARTSRGIFRHPASLFSLKYGRCYRRRSLYLPTVHYHTYLPFFFLFQFHASSIILSRFVVSLPFLLHRELQLNKIAFYLPESYQIMELVICCVTVAPSRVQIVSVRLAQPEPVPRANTFHPPSTTNLSVYYIVYPLLPFAPEKQHSSLIKSPVPRNNR